MLRGDWLTQGPAIAEFEDAVAAACGVPHAVAFSSGTAALHAAAFAAGLGTDSLSSLCHDPANNRRRQRSVT